MRNPILMSVFVLLMTAGVLADLPPWLTGVSIMPSSEATTDSIVSVTLWGVWANSNVPNASSHSVLGNDIQVSVFAPLGPDLPVLSGWSLTETIGKVPAGVYSLYVSAFTYHPPNISDTVDTSGLVLLASGYQVTPEPGAAFLFLMASSLNLCLCRASSHRTP